MSPTDSTTHTQFTFERLGDLSRNIVVMLKVALPKVKGRKK